ncbi:hypothetical protein CGLO_03054 [Colletotrichum gloeosporioides Cg-14]|uniref:Uncharacterized protein n=1 Tax=Colletotrichum gloeosporioides (strain Cg-14) TaxID=1237896 RepID=T0KXG0_COLGC|nr:hypothetical protein CGLO_03054 [Colletotrichum gloeosporioides Cg-14]
MAPVMSVPQGHTIGDRVIRPQDMRAITVLEDTKVIMRDQDGNQVEAPVPKGTIGYAMCDAPNLPGYSLAQLLNDNDQLQTVALRRSDAALGQTHGLRVEKPRVAIERAIVPLATERVGDVAAQAIVQMWHGIRENLDTLISLGLGKSNVYKELLDDEDKFRNTLNELIASFTDEVWEVIKSGCDINSLLTIQPVSRDYPEHDPLRTTIYLLLYPREENPAQGSTDFGKYGGKTTVLPWNRLDGHITSFADETNTTPHYRMARSCTEENQIMLPMMALKAASDVTISMAEMTICCLFRTWHPGNLTHSDVNSATDAAVIKRRALISMFRDICDEALKTVGFPLLHRKGCNWALPLEDPHGQRREWLRYHVISEGRNMSIFRTRSRVSLELHGSVRFKVTVPVTNRPLRAWVLSYSLDHLDPKPPVGTPVAVSIQSMDDLKPHATPWYRGPLHSAWDNSDELHSFSVTAEWYDETTRKWVSVTVQNSETFSRRNIQLPTDHYHRAVGGDISYNDPWIMATRMLQFIHNRRYDNPPPFLARSLNVDVKDVVWNHMEQAVRFVPRTKYNNAAVPKRVTFLQNWNAIQQTWPNLMIGPKPEGFEWKCAVCSALATSRLPTGNKRILCKPITAAEIEPDEIAGLGATAEQIASWTCQICWTAYRRPCVWINKDVFTQTNRPTSGQYAHVYTLPQFPGLVPVFPRQLQAAELPPALPEYDIYHLKGELDTNEEDAEDNIVDEFAVVG